MDFEWDEEKNRININKHGISFQTAAKVFLDPDRLEFDDTMHSNKSEIRSIVIGKVHKVLFVAYTERTNVIRLISTRRATKDEEDIYYDNII